MHFIFKLNIADNNHSRQAALEADCYNYFVGTYDVLKNLSAATLSETT